MLIKKVIAFSLLLSICQVYGSSRPTSPAVTTQEIDADFNACVNSALQEQDPFVSIRLLEDGLSDLDRRWSEEGDEPSAQGVYVTKKIGEVRKELVQKMESVLKVVGVEKMTKEQAFQFGLVYELTLGDWERAHSFYMYAKKLALFKKQADTEDQKDQGDQKSPNNQKL